MAQIKKQARFRYACKQLLQSRRHFRYATNALTVRKKFRIGSASVATKKVAMRYKSMSEDIVSVVTAKFQGDLLSGSGQFQQASFRVWIENKGAVKYLLNDTIKAVSKFSVQRTKNEPMTWSIAILDNDGIYSPRNPNSGWADLLTTEHMTNSAITKKFFIEVMLSASGKTITYTWPDLVLLSRNYQATPQGYSLALSGTDVVGRLLVRRNVIMPSYISTENIVQEPVTGGALTTLDRYVYHASHGNWVDGSAPSVFVDGVLISSGFTVNYLEGIVTFAEKQTYDVKANYTYVTSGIVFASKIVRDVLAHIGITSYDLSFDDFPVRQLHIQNEKPLDVINKVLFVPNAVWHSEGSTFIARQPSSRTSYDWTYEDYLNIFQLGENEQLLELVNQVTVGIPASKTTTETVIEGDKFGRYTVSFNPPLRELPQINKVSIRGGGISQIDYFDVAGNWIGHFEGDGTDFLDKNGVRISNIMPQGIDPQIIDQIYPKGVPIAQCMFNFVPVVVADTSQAIGSMITPFMPSYLDHYFRIIFVGRNSLAQELSPYIPAPIGNLQVPSEIIAAMASYNPSPNQAKIKLISPHQQYSITVKNQESINRNGLWAIEQPVENALLPNLMWAWRLGVQIIMNSGRIIRIMNFRCPMNPFMQIGDTVRIKEGVSYLDEVFLVESISFDASSSGSADSSFTAVKYQS